MVSKPASQFTKVIFLFFLLFIVTGAIAQCPDNIGFESGTFQNWEIYQGMVSKADGSISMQQTAPTGRFTMLQNTYPQVLDPYGNFPVNCPNGSNYSIKLGTSSTGGYAESVTYTFTIPANQDNYSIIYNYAVVLQNPNHSVWQQPGFFSKVFDVTTNQYIDCGAFNFVASSNLPGFQLSNTGTAVYYKPWSPITVKLVGYAGKTIRLEFTAHDCAPGGHFGYAYLDVNENCASPVSGNIYCAGSTGVTLTAPFGFSDYQWYNSDYSQLMGTSNTLTINPPPAPNTQFHVVIAPYPGLGCLDTLNTTIQLSPDPFNLQVVNTIIGCSSDKVDLTSPAVTAGSSSGLTYSYFTDLSQINYVPTPKQVTSAGVYYIKGQNLVGCNDIKPVNVVFKAPPNLVVKDPLPVCFPKQVDITAASITAGSDPGLIYSYWMDASATVPLPNPKTLSVSGTYYISVIGVSGCSLISPVNVKVSTTPVLTVKDQTACGYVDLTAPGVVSSNQNDAVISYWQDNATTINVATPGNIQLSGNYYVKAVNPAGCIAVATVQVKVFYNPDFTFTQPAPVTLPNTVDLTILPQPVNNVVTNYSYWLDSAATINVLQPSIIALSGVYYIKAVSVDGCIVLDSVKIVVNEPPIIPPNIFSPNNDGINDTWDIPLLRFYPLCTVDIYTRNGQPVFHSNGYTSPWDGKFNDKMVPIGTYYYIIKVKPKQEPIAGSVTIIQ